MSLGKVKKRLWLCLIVCGMMLMALLMMAPGSYAADPCANGHDWKATNWEWSEDYSTAKCTLTCKRDASHTKTVDATVTRINRKPMISGMQDGRDQVTAKYTEGRTTFVDWKIVTLHDWDEGTVTKEPTCTETGEKTYTCANCGETKTEEINALGHEWKATNWEWSEDYSTAKCTLTCQ